MDERPSCAFNNQQKTIIFKPTTSKSHLRTDDQQPKASAETVSPSANISRSTTVTLPNRHSNKTAVNNEPEDWSIAFQMELGRCSQTANQLKQDLKQHLNPLSQKAKSKKATNKPNSFQNEKVAAIKAKIHELEMQMQGARFGFDRASEFADVEMRRQRECFRLASRLPALSKRVEFEEKVTQSQFLVVMGQTGSGKSTQLTQYLADMPQFENKYVICTQPRKIAAVSLAKRVVFEFAAGKETNITKKWIGYHVSGDKRIDPNNKIQYMTETILLNQLTQSLTGFDPFKNCCAVIVDEAHSRNITTDVLLGVLKKQIHLWPHLKVIVTSATIDTDLFSRYLNNCPVIEIPGRLYPVEVLYRPFDRDHGNVIEAVVNQALDICKNHKTGDILCFLTGQNEVEWAKQKCSASIKSSKLSAAQISVFALYGKQTPEEQRKVFICKPNERKIIFATDIAETSVTIDGIVFIVDSGFTKNLVFDSKRNISTLKEMMISASSAEQRKGRAGRTAPGICYRMYSEEDYESMPKFDKAEIFLRPLGITVTLLKAMNVDPFNFEWLELPDRVALEIAMEELLLLGALDHRQNLTGLGTLISDLQIDPGIARMMHYACSKGLGKVSTILAGLFSVSSMVFWRGSDEDTQRASNEAKKRFLSDHGDIVSLYKVFTEWKANREADQTQKKAKAWCMENFVNHKAMNMVLTTAREIETYMLRGASYLWKKCQLQNLEATTQDLQQLAAQAFLLNVALLVNKNYIALRADVLTYVHPGSIFFRDKEMPKVVAFQNILRTSKAFAMQITPIEMEWIQQENEVLHAMYEERLQQVNSCEAKVSPVSRGILRFILGPGNRNIDLLNQQLDCLVYGDFDNDSLTAWCKPAACNLITRELNRLLSNRKSELESVMREDSLIGETRIVWGCGGEGKMLLFSGDYIGINIRNVPKTWSLVDLDLTLRRNLSQQINESICNLFFLAKSDDQSKKSARVIFNSPLIAAAAIKELLNSDGSKLECSPALSNRPSAYREPEAWLNVSFALGATQKSAILTYRTAQDANAALDNRPFSFMSPSRPKINHSQQDPGQNYDPLVQNSRFVETNLFNIKRNYAVYLRGLAPSLDEVDVQEELKRRGCPLPFAIKINRNAEIVIPKTDTQTVKEALLSYAQSRGFLPFQDKVIETYVKKDARCKLVNIRARYQTMDDVEMVFVTQPNMYHLDQSVRFQAQFKISLRVEKELWQFRETQIKRYLDGMKVQRISFRINNKSPIHIWLFVESPRLEFLDTIRKKVDEFLHFKFYKHTKLDLLFTRYGNAQLLALDVKPGFINSNFTAKRIRIYGDEQERNHVIALLDGLVQQLQALVIDVPLVIRKACLPQVSQNLATYQNAALSCELRIFYNRVMATGTEDGIEMLNDALKDHLLPPRTEINPGECGLCFDTLINPISLQLCAHKFCTDCVKPMIEQQVIPYPIVCPYDGCQIKVCVKDVEEIAPLNVLEKIGESAVAALLQHNPDKYRPCFKPGCEQYLPVREDLNEKEQARQGGNIVGCDQCNLHYCATCSAKMHKPVERHRGETCAESQRFGNKDCRLHRLYILDEICLLRCPRCKTAFIDFDGCCALYCCMPRCKAGFCFFCLQDCGTDAHSHIRTCTLNPNKGEYYIASSQKNTVHKETRKRAIVHYLTNKCEDRAMRSAVLHSIEKDLKGLEIVIEPNEVGLTGLIAIADTSKHRQHILDEICTLHCPHCHEAFDDFDGCCAIECWSERCKTHFCFFCLQDCGRGFDGEQKSHAHVMKCLQNVKPGQLSISAPEIKAFNQRRRKLAVVKYLVENCHEQSERRAVIDSVAINLKHLDIVISPEDVRTSSVNGAMPAAQRYVPVQPPQVNIAPPINPFAHPPIFPNPPVPPRQEIPPRPRRPNDNNCTFL